jgi:hypothetical protein
MGARQMWTEVLKQHTVQAGDGWWTLQKNVVLEVMTAAEHVDYGSNGPPTYTGAKVRLDSDDFLVLYRPAGGIFESKSETTTYIPWPQVLVIRFRQF